MSTKLIQKQLFRGTHEYEIVDEQVNVRVKSRVKDEAYSVMLAVLDAEPIITKTHLEFVSRVNGEALLSLVLSKPNVSEFNAFVSTLKQRAQAEYNTFSGMNVETKPADMTGFSEQPPEFDEHSTADIIKNKKVSVEGLDNAIYMLETYVNNEEIQPLLSALATLKQAPRDHAKLVEVATAFNQLGPTQGAVLTYAPYVSIMLSDDPFGTG